MSHNVVIKRRGVSKEVAEATRHHAAAKAGWLQKMLAGIERMAMAGRQRRRRSGDPTAHESYLYLVPCVQQNPTS